MNLNCRMCVCVCERLQCGRGISRNRQQQQSEQIFINIKNNFEPTILLASQRQTK